MAASCNRESEKSQHGGGNGSARNRSLRILIGASIVRSAFRTARSATNRVKKLGCVFRAGSTLIHTVVARDDRFGHPTRPRIFNAPPFTISCYPSAALFDRSPDCWSALTGQDGKRRQRKNRQGCKSTPDHPRSNNILPDGSVLKGPFLPPGQAIRETLSHFAFPRCCLPRVA